MAEPLAELWLLHQKAPFPQAAVGLAIGGVSLLALDAAVGAILTGCLRTDGVPRPMPESAKADLGRHRAALDRVLAEPSLEGETRSYFGRLARLSDLLLRG